MLKIAVCDDEKTFINTMSKLINSKLENKIEKLDTFINPYKLLEKINLYDLIFLDIDMPQINGIELVRQYEENNLHIVFVTNKEALVFEAYNTTSTFGFIRKSNLYDDFISVIKRFEKNNQGLHYLPVKSRNGIIKCKFSDIYYIEKQINHVIIHTKSSIYKVADTLSNLENTLESFGFIRTHIGYIVNLDCIVAINDKEVEISDGEKIPVSRNKSKYVKIEFLKRSVAVNE